MASCQENGCSTNIHAAILKIMTDTQLSEQEKLEKRKQLMAQQWGHLTGDGDEEDQGGVEEKENKKLDNELNCVICLSCCQKPVTAACQHSFCLKCFKRWVQQEREKNCPTCRAPISRDMINNPRINTILAMAIRFAKQGQHENKRAKQREYKYLKDDKSQRPEKAQKTERAVKTGMANAASGRMMVKVPERHFGAITAEMDVTRGLGVRVGDWWTYRLDAYQWGVHMNHVGGISGQARLGAQSVVISGGYEDDRDEGDWFLYTGSGGRDLSGNKRTNKTQSFDQEFALYNESLRQSCLKGLPVRVVRSVKEKRSAYAPPAETPIRYDGLYRVMACWRKPGAQKLLMCRYLFVRADNEASPWAEEEGPDKPMEEIPKEAVQEMEHAADGQVWKPVGKPFWNFDEENGQWVWTRDPPILADCPKGAPQRSKTRTSRPIVQQPKMRKVSLKKFACGLCKDTLIGPVVTPCGHQFCLVCINARFDGLGDVVVPQVGRSLRGRKVSKPCPACNLDLGEFLKNLQVNRDLEKFIEGIKASQVVNDGQDESGSKDEQSDDKQDVSDNKDKGNQESSSKDEETNEKLDVADKQYINIDEETNEKLNITNKQYIIIDVQQEIPQDDGSVKQDVSQKDEVLEEVDTNQPPPDDEKEVDTYKLEEQQRVEEQDNKRKIEDTNGSIIEGEENSQELRQNNTKRKRAKI
eukprot:TRINITY_DN5148_c0_g2_i12.p1 TRINITY_DN5148_c0_g2~~TRINITY_DN5148_c0_g2_i12.p1  ORF type:complete len:716 (+),score=104.15 TRINITY_DN5148_c0_g2_i12:60-2150(+)